MQGDPGTGLASLVAELIEQNLRRDPGRRRLLERRARVAIAATDAGAGATLRIGGGRVRVQAGLDRSAPVVIRGRSDDLLALAGSPLRWGLPDLAAPQGRRAIVMLLRGRVRVRGLLTRPRQVVTLLRLLSAGSADAGRLRPPWRSSG
jgi:hypothetical protein